MVKVFSAVMSLLLVTSLFAQQLEEVGVIEDGWEYAEIKHPRPTSEFMKYSPEWVHREIFVGSILRTTKGYNSQFELLFRDGSRVVMLPGSRMKVEKEEGVVLLNLPVGELHIESGGRLRVKTPEGYLHAVKGTKYRVRLGVEGREALYTVLKGELLVKNRQGVVFNMKEGAKGELKYDAEEDSYSFLVAPDTESKIRIIGKDAETEEGPGATVLLLGDGGFKIEEPGKPIKEIKKPILPEGLKVSVGFNIVFAGRDYEARQNYNYYRGGEDSFELNKAELTLEGLWRDYMRICLSVDGMRDDMLKNAYLELFPRKYPYRLRFRFGQFRVPFGIETQTSLQDLLLGDRSLMTKYGFCGLRASPDSYESDMQYDIGFSVLGYLIGRRDEEGFAIDYALGLLNGAGRNSVEDDSRKTLSCRVGFRLAKWLTVGGSYYDGSTDTGDDEYHRRRRGADLRISFNDRFDLTVEYIRATDNPRVGKHGNETEAFYIQSRIPLPFLGEKLKRLALVFRYEMMNPAFKSVPGITRDDWEKVTRWDVGFRWDVSGQIGLILYYEILDQGDARYPLGFSPEDADETLNFVLLLKYL